MKQILPFNQDSPEIQERIRRIMDARPVRNLTEAEVAATLRLIELQDQLGDNLYGQVVVHKNDRRLELCDDNDRFLALLLDCDQREVLLGTKRCRYVFGGTPYYWRKIARQSPVTATASAISECGSGYYGRGWKIAPHIERLRRWIRNVRA